MLEYLTGLGLRHPSRIPDFLLEAFRDYYRVSDRTIIQVTDCARYDSALFYLFREGECTFTNREFSVVNRFNAAGLRDDQTSLDYPHVIALGDSYTMGWGVNQDESFPQILERQAGVRMLNAGVSSFGTMREMLLLRRLPVDSAKVLLIQYHANDFDENNTAILSNFALPIRRKNSYDSLRKAIENREKYYPFKHLYGITRGFARQTLRPGTAGRGEAAEAQSFLKVVRNAGIPSSIQILVFKLDDYQKLNDDFADAVDSLLTTPDFQALNIRTIRVSHILDDADYFILDEHINASGHRKIAAEISRHITSLSP